MTPVEDVASDNLDSHHMSTKFVELLTRILKPRSNKFSFQVEGLLFDISLVPVENGSHMQIASEIGFLPFTEESAAKRRMLSAILARASDLNGPLFALGSDGKITVSGNLFVTQKDTPIFSFAKIIQFIHQIMPYVKLIGKIL